MFQMKFAEFVGDCSEASDTIQVHLPVSSMGQILGLEKQCPVIAWHAYAARDKVLYDTPRGANHNGWQTI